MFHGIIAAALLVFAAVAGLVLVFLGLPGTFGILIGALLYDLVTWSLDIGWGILITLLVLAVLGELFDVVVGAIAAKRFGTSKLGVLGAVLGAIIGGVFGIPIPVIGSVVGLFLGAFVGAFVLEFVRTFRLGKAFKGAVGAFAGRMMSIFVKLELALIMLVLVFAAIWF